MGKENESNIIPFRQHRKRIPEGPFQSNDERIQDKLAHLGQQFQIAINGNDQESIDAILSTARELKDKNL